MLPPSQDESQQRISTLAQGSTEAGGPDASKNDSTRSEMSISGSQSSRANLTSLPTSLPKRKTHQFKKHKEALDKKKSKLKKTFLNTSRDWSTMSPFQRQEIAAAAAKANVSVDNIPRSSHDQKTSVAFRMSEGSRRSSEEKRYSSMTAKESLNFNSSITSLSTVSPIGSRTHFRKLSKEESSGPAVEGAQEHIQGTHKDEEEELIEISSDEEEDNLSVSEDDDQLDSEWLDLSDVEIDEHEAHQVISRKSRTEQSIDKQRISGVSSRGSISSVTSESHKRFSSYAYHDHTYYPLKFLYVMLPVYKALLFLGRFPFEIDISEDIPVYKLNKKSWRYFLFIGTSLLSLFTSLLMVANLISISTIADPPKFHESILRYEQEKYWIEGTLEISNMIFVTVFSVSMMEYGGGVFLVDFLNRWSQSVSIIRYDVTPGLKNMVYIFFWFYGIYAVVIIILFFAGGEKVPTIRGMCGYTGILICKTFASELRLRAGFRAVEFLGLFVHLYATLAGSLIILLISMQCWALENAAKRFNHRLASCLHGIGFRNPASIPPESRFMPYSKLFAEHLVVTSFPGYIGKTFSFGFVLYLGCKMVDMIVTLFGVAEPIVNGFHESNETFVDVYAQSHYDPQLVVPIMIVEPFYIQSIKCGLYVAKTWLPWFIFMEIVQRPGTTIIRGSHLIVRNCYIKCKNTHALRFIASMEFSFSNRAVFFVNPGVQVTRSFVGKFVGFALAIFLTLLQFIPAEVNTQSTIICDHFGSCAQFQFPSKSRSHDGYQKTIGKTISEDRHATPKPLLPPPVYEKDFDFPPCVFGGLLPVNQSASFGFNCSHKEDSVFIPTYFRKSSNKFIQIPPTADHSCVKSSELPLNETLFDCYGDEVKVVETDECGNPRLPTTDLQGIKKLPDLRVVKFNSSEIFCCYAYGGLENQAERCNLMSAEVGSHKCTRKSKTEDREKYEKVISALWDEPDEDAFSKVQHWWTLCLCQGLDDIQISKTICAASIDLDGSCLAYPLVRDPCKHCLGSPRKMFKEHYLYQCRVGELKDQNHRIFALPNPVKFVKDSTDLTQPVPWGYPCEKQTTIKDRSEEEGDYQDCYGQHVNMQSHEYKDDCGTRKLFFPDRFTGEMVLPAVKVVKFDRGDHPFPGTFFSFVCCWNYEEWQESEVDSKCNLYPGSDLSKVCSYRVESSDAEAIRRCNDITNGSKLYVEKCVDRNGKAFNTCHN